MARGLCHSATWRRSCWSCAGLPRTTGLAWPRADSQASWAESNCWLRQVSQVSVPARAKWSTWTVMNSRRTAWAGVAGGWVVPVPVSALADAGISPASSASRWASSPMNTGIHAATVWPPRSDRLGRNCCRAVRADANVQGVGPVGQVRSDGHAGFQDLPLVARLQQLGGLLRPQPESCYGPWPDARLGSRLGRRASHGAGRHGGVAPAGQPSDCAGEVAVARFEADLFGHDAALGRNRGVSRPPAGRAASGVARSPRSRGQRFPLLGRHAG